MKEFKYKEKEPVSDEQLLKYKNFNAVLDKHQTISRGYKAVWKIWGGIGIASILAAVGLIYLFSNEESSSTELATTPPAEIHMEATANKVQPETSSIQLASMETTVAVQKESKTIPAPQQPADIKDGNRSELQAPDEQSELAVHEPEELKSSPEEQETTQSNPKNKKEEIVEYFKLQQKPEAMKVQLPTLYIAGKEWPTIMKKGELVKRFNVTSYYNQINQEVPVISYVVSRVTPDELDYKHRKILNQDNRKAASVIQEIHRSKVGEFLLFKNIQVYIPGIGRTNLGDHLIEIVDDSEYQKRLREKKRL